MIEIVLAASLIQQLLWSSPEGEGPPTVTHDPVVFAVADSEPDGDFDDADVEAALAACDAAAPRGGCDVQLLTDTTYVDVQVKVGPHVRFFRGGGDGSLIRGPIAPDGEAIIRREPRDGGWPTVFEDFRIDGRKQELTADPGGHNCIEIGDSTSNQLAGGTIQRVTCENVAKEGFQIEDAPGWSFLDNTLRYLGCHQNWSPDGIIDPALMDCGPWATGQPDDDNQPGRTTPGIGIEVQRNSDDAVIVGNLVEYFTKIGIQGIDSQIAAEPSYPARGLVRGNTIRWGLSGVALVRTNDWTVDDNDLFDIGASWQFGNVGAATSCSFAGRRSQFTNNDVRRTSGSGMGIACDCGATVGGGFGCGVVATGNRIEDACGRDTTFGTFFADTLGSLGTAVGLTATGNTIVSSACPTELNLDGYVSVTTDLATGGPPPAYRTIVIIGDTQSHINGTDAIGEGGRYDDLNDQITWIIENRITEGIDLVVHVGDMIDAGNNLPLSDGCDGDPVITPVLTCAAENGNGEAACDAIAGCAYAAHNGNCAPCTKVDDAAAEWARFLAIWSRLDGLVPYILTKGNHDNRGHLAALFPDRDTNGWDQLFDDTYWEGLETGFAAWNYDHLSAVALDGGGVEGFSRAWRTDVGGVTFTIVAPAAASGTLIDAAAQQWSADTLNLYPSDPGILLAHYIGLDAFGGDIADSVIDVSESVAPTLFLAAGGHTSGNSVNVVTNGGELVLEIVTDWTSATSNDTGGTPQNDYMTRVQVWTGESPTELSVRDYSVGSGLFENGLGASNRLDRQDFDIYPPSAAIDYDNPYDLSGLTTDTDAVFGVGLRPSWPTGPTVDGTPVVATDCSSLAAGLTAGGERVTVGAGVTIGSSGSPCGSITIAADTWLDMDSTSTIFASLTGADNPRIRMTGGNVTQFAPYTMSGDDLLVMNGTWVKSGGGTLFDTGTGFAGLIGSRRAFVQNDLTGGSYAIFTQIWAGPTYHDDIIIVGNRLRGGTTQNEVTVRLMNTDGAIYADNFCENDDNSKACLRFYDYTRNVLIADNAHIAGSSYSYEVASVPTHPGDMDNVRIVRNRAFKNTTHAAQTVTTFQAAGGGFTCTNFFFADNELITPDVSPYTDQNCGGAGGGGTASDLDAAPYFGVIPDCSTLGCGPQ